MKPSGDSRTERRPSIHFAQKPHYAPTPESPKSPAQDKSGQSSPYAETEKRELGKKSAAKATQGKGQEGQQDEDENAIAGNEQDGQRTDTAVSDSVGDNTAMREEQNIGSPEMPEDGALGRSMARHIATDESVAEGAHGAPVSGRRMAHHTDRTDNTSPEEEERAPEGTRAGNRDVVLVKGTERAGEEISTATKKKRSPRRFRRKNKDIGAEGTAVGPDVEHREPRKHGKVDGGDVDDQSSVTALKKREQGETSPSKDMPLEKGHRRTRSKAKASLRSQKRRGNRSRRRREISTPEESDEVSTRCVETQTLLVAPVVEAGGEGCRDFKFGIDLKPITRSNLPLRTSKYSHPRHVSPSNQRPRIKQRELAKDTFTVPGQSPEMVQPSADENQLKSPRDESPELAEPSKAPSGPSAKGVKRKKRRVAAVSKDGRQRPPGDKRRKKSPKSKPERKGTPKIKSNLQDKCDEPTDQPLEQVPEGSEEVEVKSVKETDREGIIADKKEP
ncbi:hypothetical protein HPB48_010428 [Haemaphysalis longicornis]|uniref:Uncharacterized protein n=1 Tax=Haemaphysalis longicornis TaxID=44386 RepID=A0A9J6H5X2_HAELO|nr:hypothetical protein HPB48_010428 [Haemaphysalis longicornis]